MHPIIRHVQTNVQKGQLKSVPRIEAGYTVQVSQKIKEGSKERIQKFQGLVIKKNSGEGPEQTITVRKIVEGIGVEKIFPLHSPNVVEFRVIKKAKIRRSKLYYMRDRRGKSARLSETQVSDEDRKREREEREKQEDDMIEEAVAAAEKEEMNEQEQGKEEVAATKADEVVDASESDSGGVATADKKEEVPEGESSVEQEKADEESAVSEAPDSETAGSSDKNKVDASTEVQSSESEKEKASKESEERAA